MFTKPLITIICLFAFALLAMTTLMGLLLWRGHVLQTETAKIRTELADTKTALKAQQDTFTAYRTQTNTMLQQLNAANAQAATDQQNLQDAIKNEDGQTWGNARLPDAVASVLNQK